MDIVGVAAVDKNNIIGDGDNLPWSSIAADKRQYRETVADSPVILGRKTYELMRDDLPGRSQIVLTRSKEYSSDDKSAQIVHSRTDAIASARRLNEHAVYVLGGASIYRLFLSTMSHLRLSRINGEYSGTHTFPTIDLERWTLQEERPYQDFTLELWRRNDNQLSH